MSCIRNKSSIFFTLPPSKPAATSEYPDSFYCPITHKLFENPIILSTGITIDKSALIKINKICPITKQPLENVFQVNGRNTFYVINITLKNIIDEYKNKLQQLKPYQSRAKKTEKKYLYTIRKNKNLEKEIKQDEEIIMGKYGLQCVNHTFP